MLFRSPYARKARINNRIEITFSEVSDLYTSIKESFKLLETKDVVIICFDHTMIEPEDLQHFISSVNKDITKQNYVVLEDHPNSIEYVNGLRMNFSHCGLLLIQKLDKLTEASEQLRSKGYYDVWNKEELDSVVNWR